MQNLFNVNQVAYILKVHPLTIRRYIKSGKLKAVRVGGSIRIQESDLQQATKEFAPQQKASRHIENRKPFISKPFDVDDPFLRLEGRGVSLKLNERT